MGVPYVAENMGFRSQSRRIIELSAQIRADLHYFRCVDPLWCTATKVRQGLIAFAFGRGYRPAIVLTEKGKLRTSFAQGLKQNAHFVAFWPGRGRALVTKTKAPHCFSASCKVVPLLQN